MTAIYARQSIDKKDSISIDTQIEIAKKELKEEEYKVYADRGYSGKNTRRPSFENLMEDVSSGRVNKIVVYRLDRISRSIVDFADFINTLNEHNVSFVSATEKFDTASPMGKAMLYIIAVFAQLERETISERITDNYYARVRNGAVGGGPAPYGFNLVKKQIDGIKMSIYEPNEKIETVCEIFDLYAEPNTSLADVQRYLAKKGIKTVSGKAWDNAKISTLLKSPAYVKADVRIYNYYKSLGAIIANKPEDFNGINGCVMVGKRDANTRKYANVANHLLVVSKHKGVIDSGIFLTCQYKLKNNRQIKNTGKGKYTWLTGFIKCNHCGYSFSVRKTKLKNGVVPYFYCSGRYLYKVCDLKQTHRVAEIEKLVIEKINAFVGKKGFVTKQLTKESEEQQRFYDNKISEIDAKIELLILSIEESNGAAINYITTRINELDKTRKELLAEQAQHLQYERQKQPENFDFNALDFDGKKRVCALLIDKILLDDKTLKIIWK